MTWRYQASVPGRVDAVRDLALAARQALEAVWPSGEALDDAELALVEACNNVAIHAYADGARAGSIDLDLALVDDALVITVRDTGPPFVPAAMPEDPLSEHGRGLMILHALAKEVTFERHGEVNSLRCVLAAAPDAP